MPSLSVQVLLLWVISVSFVFAVEGDSYSELVLEDQPTSQWTFDSEEQDTQVTLRQVGQVSLGEGPLPPHFPLLHEHNQARFFDGKSYLRIQDPGEHSDFDFAAGDSITLEAWVAPTRIPGTYAYVIGKGRTYLNGPGVENHNWSLRLKKEGGRAAISFLFRSAGKKGQYHRWESSEGIAVGDGWHHIAVTLTFGEAKNLKGYIDGQPVKGKWDLGGATDLPPVVDDDEVWIGSAMGGSPGSCFQGGIDEIAIYRHIVSAERMAKRFRFEAPKLPPVEVPSQTVLVQIFEDIPDKDDFAMRAPRLAESFTRKVFAFPELPKRYNERGVQQARPTPFMVHAHADVRLPEGRQRLLFRSREVSRLFVDDELVAETKPYAITVTANGPIWDLDRSHSPNIRPLQRGDRQQVVELEGDGEHHRVRLEILVGLHKRRPEMGDAHVSLASGDGDFRIVSFESPFEVTETGWAEFRAWDRERLRQINRARRESEGATELDYWRFRHQIAREWVENTEHDPSRSIDSFLPRASSASEREHLDDLAFLRRLSLDTIGKIPDRQQISEYLSVAPDRRHTWAVDYFLDQDSWADHWVGYWQDVLAENPNIVNPTLNNTGPFRWWIYESFLENKSFDRFVTELIMMEGDALGGGPGGFALATENDVPMAAKGHILAQAFLGVQMQCARCHDAPAHEVDQRDLFEIAAMLDRKAQQVPLSSSIDLSPEEIANMAVRVTLKPGSEVSPAWPFQEFSDATFPAGVVRDAKDTREQLAAYLTLPQNDRFAEVVVNRVWKRYMGVGFVDSLNDWESAERANEELLDWLSCEFKRSGYDLKFLAKLILSSDAYRHGSTSEMVTGPIQKKLAAEQLLDSLFVISEKPFEAGLIAVDIDGARPSTLSLNLGEARRAWMFTSTSNERDRPGLALPFAQPFVTFLESFGWRGARQNPISQRPDELTAAQPAELANGVLARRTTRLSDDHAVTQVALRSDLTLDQLCEELTLRIYTRFPTDREVEILQSFLQPGFENRLKLEEPIIQKPRDRRGTISWSNHLEEEASTIKLELEKIVSRGDPPTRRLESEWRERLEDTIWSMINSPEFRFSP